MRKQFPARDNAQAAAGDRRQAPAGEQRKVDTADYRKRYSAVCSDGHVDGIDTVDARRGYYGDACRANKLSGGVSRKRDGERTGGAGGGTQRDRGREAGAVDHDAAGKREHSGCILAVR